MNPTEPSSIIRSAAGRRLLAAVSIILIAGALVFLPSLQYGFVNWDDPAQILNNPYVQDLSPAGIHNIFRSLVVRQYHPLVTLSFALEYHLFRINPSPYHLHNLLLHLLNCVLVFSLAYRLSERRILSAFLAGIFFAVHPLQAGAVAWVSGRKDLLSSGFFLASLLAYLRYLNGKSRKAFALSLAFGLLALAAKASAAVLPLAMLLSDWKTKRKFTPGLLLEKLPLFLAGAVISALTLSWQLQAEAGIHHRFSWEAGNIFLAGRTLIFYLQTSLFPLRLSPLYPYISRPALFSGPVMAAIAASAALIGSAIRTPLFRGEAGRNRLFGVLFFLLAILPAIRIVPFGGTEEVALRFAYLPLAGLCFAAGATLDAAFPRGRARTTALVAALAAAVCFSALNWEINRSWRDGGAFWSRIIQKFPDFDIAHHQLAAFYFSRRDYPSTITHTARAIELNPEIAYAYVIKGLAHRGLGEPEPARTSLLQAQKILREMGRTEEAARVTTYLQQLDPPEF